jgi:hypothetical protein
MSVNREVSEDERSEAISVWLHHQAVNVMREIQLNPPRTPVELRTFAGSIRKIAISYYQLKVRAEDELPEIS